MGAINVGLKRRSYDQLSLLLGEDFTELHTESGRHSATGQKWLTLRKLSEESSTMNSALFCSCNFNDNYERISEVLFHLYEMTVNVSNPQESALVMNHRISMMAHGSLLNQFDQSMLSENRMIFIHTLFFREDWETKFNSALTKREIFYNDNGEQLEVDMMNQEGYNKIYGSFQYNFRILFKPFHYKKLFSVIVLPRGGYNLDDVLKSFKVFVSIIEPDQMGVYFERATKIFAKLKLPKFKIYAQNDLIDPFMHYGVTDIFHRNHSDFGRMTNTNVFIGNLMQVANIAFDEEGARAEEVPSEAIEDESHKYEFYVTKPFLFFVYAPSERVVILSAVVINPNAS
ncbi:Glia-derived nexin [Thelohanellus kitauei]|uniref:Glia-derived nexin n=1 Tax=Thelohanellus kitauei TaxID=669202 RepID=A0A0C2MU43_THEKT|nr:Glia-derived nexin [Thelohanellus kitauei]